MSKQVDPNLLEVAARFSAPPIVQTKDNMSEVRAAARAARVDLVGRHADSVTIAEDGVVRTYTPADHDASTVILYIHGGGWINCDTVTHGAIMTDLAALSGHVVIGPDYPLAPEAPYPAGLDMLCDLALQLRADYPDTKLVLGGDSAGANLALAVALRLRDQGKGDAVSALLLWYGCYRRLFDTRSHQAYGDGSFGLRTENMEQCWGWYLGDHADPVYGDLTEASAHDLPPCYLAEAELDCLADDTRWLAGKLADEGVPHSYVLHTDVNHGFIHFGQHYPPSYGALEGAAYFLKAPRMIR